MIDLVSAITKAKDVAWDCLLTLVFYPLAMVGYFVAVLLVVGVAVVFFACWNIFRWGKA